MEVISQDVGQVLTFSILLDGSPMNIAGAALTLQLNNGQNLSLSIANALGGIAIRTTLAGDFPNVGLFQAVVKIVQGGLTLFSKPFNFNVKGLYS